MPRRPAFAWPCHATAGPPGRSIRSPRPPITPSGTRPTVAPSALTAMATRLSSGSARFRRPASSLSSSCPSRPTAGRAGSPRRWSSARSPSPASSTNGGSSWAAPRSIEAPGDRGFYTAPAISPNGTDVYVVYNAFTTPFRTNTTDPRLLVGVLTHADVAGAAPTGPFGELHRGAPGDPRGSSANSLTSEFLGDYVYAVATRTYGSAVWNDARNAADCPAVDAWRKALQTGDTNVTQPAPGTVCPAAFGNSDIFGGTFTDPTP
jgi:hypothetical protein